MDDRLAVRHRSETDDTRAPRIRAGTDGEAVLRIRCARDALPRPALTGRPLLRHVGDARTERDCSMGGEAVGVRLLIEQRPVSTRGPAQHIHVTVAVRRRVELLEGASRQRLEPEAGRVQGRLPSTSVRRTGSAAEEVAAGAPEVRIGSLEVVACGMTGLLEARCRRRRGATREEATGGSREQRDDAPPTLLGPRHRRANCTVRTT